MTTAMRDRSTWSAGGWPSCAPRRCGRRRRPAIGRGRVDWAEMLTRPRVYGRERRVYALICTLPYSGASTALFSFDMTIESLVQGHVGAFDWLGGVPRECVYDNLRAVAKREKRDGVEVIHWNPRFSQLCGHYAFHAHPSARPRRHVRRAPSRARSVTTRPGSGPRGARLTARA